MRAARAEDAAVLAEAHAAAARIAALEWEQASKVDALADDHIEEAHAEFEAEAERLGAALGAQIDNPKS